MQTALSALGDMFKAYQINKPKDDSDDPLSKLKALQDQLKASQETGQQSGMAANSASNIASDQAWATQKTPIQPTTLAPNYQTVAPVVSNPTGTALGNTDAYEELLKARGGFSL